MTGWRAASRKSRQSRRRDKHQSQRPQSPFPSIVHRIAPMDLVSAMTTPKVRRRLPACCHKMLSPPMRPPFNQQ